jgi:hypothetical protein
LNADLSYTFKPTPQGAVVPEMTIGLRGENLFNDEIRYSLVQERRGTAAGHQPAPV